MQGESRRRKKLLKEKGRGWRLKLKQQKIEERLKKLKGRDKQKKQKKGD